MFEAAVDQADGLRRLFSPRVPSSVIPIGCSAPAAACRGYAASLLDALTRIGFTPMLFDRLDLDHELGEVQAHSPVNRLLLLEEPVRLARWLRGRQSSMLLLLSHHRDALPPQYATIKSIVGGHGLQAVRHLVRGRAVSGRGGAGALSPRNLRPPIPRCRNRTAAAGRRRQYRGPVPRRLPACNVSRPGSTVSCRSIRWCRGSGPACPTERTEPCIPSKECLTGNRSWNATDRWSGGPRHR